MDHRFKVGEVVQFSTVWPYGQTRVRILEVLPERESYRAIELDYYRGWAESTDGPRTFWLGSETAHVITEDRRG